MTPVWLHRGNRWCVLRSAWPGGRVTTLCAAGQDYGLVLIATSRPAQACPACEAELAAGTEGAATVPDPGRTPTVDLRGPGALDAEDDWGPNPAAVAEALHEDLLDEDLLDEVDLSSGPVRGRSGR